jgi:ankyrin repeat protein
MTAVGGFMNSLHNRNAWLASAAVVVLALAASRHLSAIPTSALQELCADVDDKDNPVTVDSLQAASAAGDVKAVCAWLASSDLQDDLSGALRIAAVENHANVARVLLAAGASSETDDEGNTALHAATFAAVWRTAKDDGGLAVVRTLLEFGGGDVDTVNTGGFTALHVAASIGHAGLVQALAGAGAAMDLQVHNGGLTALHLAAKEGHLEVVRAILASGADPDAKDDDGATPLVIAANSGHVEAIRALLAGGASVAVAENEGRSALHAATARERGGFDMARVLLEGGASSHSRSTLLAVTPLDCAINMMASARVDRVEGLRLVRLLLPPPEGGSRLLAVESTEEGIDEGSHRLAERVRDDERPSSAPAGMRRHPWTGQTPLHAAAYLDSDEAGGRGKSELVQLLLASEIAGSHESEDAAFHIQVGDRLERQAQEDECAGLERAGSERAAAKRAVEALHAKALEAYAAAVRAAPTSEAAHLRLGSVQARLAVGGGSNVTSFEAAAAASFGTAWRLSSQHGLEREAEGPYIDEQHTMALAGIVGDESVVSTWPTTAHSVEELCVNLSGAGSLDAVAHAVGLWRQQGVVVFPSLLNQSMLAQLRAHAQSSLSNRSVIDRSAAIRESGVRGSHRTLRAVAVGPYRNALQALASSLTRFLEGALQDRSLLLLESSVLRTSLGAPPQGWHRDSNVRDERLTKIQISLQATRLTQGALEVQPGTHRSGRADETPSDSRASATGVVMAVPEGTVVVYSPSLVHRGGVHTLRLQEGSERLVLALTVMGQHALLPTGVPITLSEEDAGRWWLESGTLQERSLDRHVASVS